MEKSLKSFLSIVLIILCLSSCEDKKEKALKVLEFGKYYQGSAQSLNALSLSAELDPTNAETHRELSIPYLKRGIPHHFKSHMDKAVSLSPADWQGYRGYNYLWFYRDYEKAIADFNALDSLTPNFIDAPQGHSIDYWRGIAYLGLKDYKNSIAYFEKHIEKETKDFGEDYVDVIAFLYNGIAHFESGDHEKALQNFNKQLEYSRDLSADAKYYKAQIQKNRNNMKKAKELMDSAIEDFNQGYNNKRPYVETLREIYLDELLDFKATLK